MLAAVVLPEGTRFQEQGKDQVRLEKPTESALVYALVYDVHQDLKDRWLTLEACINKIAAVSNPLGGEKPPAEHEL